MDPKRKNLYAIITGTSFALLFLLFGYLLFRVGQINTAPLGPIGTAGAIVVTGSTWGLNFGSALKKGEHYTRFVLLSSFFLTLIVAIIGYVAYSIVWLGQNFEGPVDLALLAVSMISTTFALHTGETEEKNLKLIIEGFSSKASYAILSGYGTILVFDIPTGIGVGLAVGGLYGVLPWLARRWWAERKKRRTKET